MLNIVNIMVTFVKSMFNDISSSNIIIRTNLDFLLSLISDSQACDFMYNTYICHITESSRYISIRSCYSVLIIITLEYSLAQKLSGLQPALADAA